MHRTCLAAYNTEGAEIRFLLAAHLPLAKLAVPKRGYRTEKWLLAYFFAQPESFSDRDDINLGCSPTNVKLKGEDGGVEAAGVREMSGKSNRSFFPPRRV